MSGDFEPTERESEVARRLYVALQISLLPMLIATNVTDSWVVAEVFLGLMVVMVLATTMWIARNHETSWRTAFMVTLRRKASDTPFRGKASTPLAGVGEAAKNALSSWRATLVIAHLAGAPLLGVYLILVAANNLAYNYSFWNDVPPTQAADRAAVASLWALLALAVVLAVLAYGWLCQHSLNGSSLRASLRESLGPGIRSLWFATPLFVVAVVAAVLVLPGLFVVPLTGAIPFLRLAPTRPVGGYWGLLRRQVLPLAVVGTAVLPVVLVLWAMVAATAASPAYPPPIAWLVGWAMCALAAIGIGGVASGFAHIYLQDALATERAGQTHAQVPPTSGHRVTRGFTVRMVLTTTVGAFGMIVLLVSGQVVAAMVLLGVLVVDVAVVAVILRRRTDT